jgi:hypothetical protein
MSPAPVFAQRHAITDVCVLCKDVEASVAFYVDKLGFKLRRRAPGFADFKGAGLTLALWEIGHISQHTGVSAKRATGGHNVAIAVELATPAEVDASYEELTGRGVVFIGPPEDYVWNARCCYFEGPDGEVWELYAWLSGGAIGDVEEAEASV